MVGIGLAAGVLSAAILAVAAFLAGRRLGRAERLESRLEASPPGRKRRREGGRAGEKPGKTETEQMRAIAQRMAEFHNFFAYDGTAMPAPETKHRPNGKEGKR